MSDVERGLSEIADLTHRLHESKETSKRLSHRRSEAVRSLREAGVSHGAIARHLGVTRSAVQQMLRDR